MQARSLLRDRAESAAPVVAVMADAIFAGLKLLKDVYKAVKEMKKKCVRGRADACW